MTEGEWLAGNSPRRMLDFVRGESSPRKLRLFVCGFLRTHLHRYNDDLSRAALDTSERFADGLATIEEVEACRRRAREEAKKGNEAAELAIAAAFMNLDRAIGQVFGHISTVDAMCNKVQLLHDVWGTLPFRPVSIDSAWLTPNVVQLAQNIYEDRAFERLPALADALEEAGCHNTDILDHCRGPGLHVRGCWVLDLILGKECLTTCQDPR